VSDNVDDGKNAGPLSKNADKLVNITTKSFELNSNGNSSSAKSNDNHKTDKTNSNNSKNINGGNGNGKVVENHTENGLKKSNTSVNFNENSHSQNGRCDKQIKTQIYESKVDALDKKDKTQHKYSLWSLKITIITFALAIFFSFLSELTASTGNIVVTVLLLVFLILGNIVFDGIGVAVTACALAPLVSMSSRKVYGAKTAMNLVKNAEKVSNICSDVIGDIFGIISGACSISIVIRLLTLFENPNQQILTIGLSSIVAALTVGGKAIVKEIAIKNSKDLVMFVARIAAIFSKDERKNKKKRHKSIEEK
ncbi:MAG TPA: hypothetical protein VJZ69_02205, partial [Clostridia bacterium]|nr:hypothetical protein [Clostridia bacterium]